MIDRRCYRLRLFRLLEPLPKHGPEDAERGTAAAAPPSWLLLTVEVISTRQTTNPRVVPNDMVEVTPGMLALMAPNFLPKFGGSLSGIRRAIRDHLGRPSGVTSPS